MMIAIGISTAGRPDLLGRTLAQLEKQIRPADRTVVCAPSLRDVGDLAGAARGVEVVTSGRGLTRQRNAILDAAEDCDLLAFFDDDFVPAASYLAAAEALFSARPEIVLSTGAVLADGIRGPGITHAEALALLDRHADHVPGGGGVRPVYNGYGCNMVVRMPTVRQRGLRFDEDLPLYGWLEDVDFSRRLAAFGEIVRASSTHGIHLGAKQGRQSGLRLGYSQVANPLYLARKNTMGRGRALRLMARNAGMNLAKALWPEPHVDRRGRLAGNAMALADLVRLRLHPRRVLDM